MEVLLAASVFILLVTAFVGAYLYGEESTALAGNRARAIFLAEEGLEAVRNIRDANFANINAGTYGLVNSGNQWIFSGSSDVNGIFTRQIIITTPNSARRDVRAQVTWQQNQSRTGLVSMSTRLSNWMAPFPNTCNGYAIQQGYIKGTCRRSPSHCKSSEDYLPDGDVYCTGGPNADTCCGTLP